MHLGACPIARPLLSARASAALAQLVEHRIRNARVTCSSHVSGTISQKIVGKQPSNGSSAAKCSPTVSPMTVADQGLTLSESTKNLNLKCSPRVSPRRHTGLWRRGAVYQYRVRVPCDVIGLAGKSRINRSLGTASYGEAIRLVRKIAFEMQIHFDDLRAQRAGEGIPTPASVKEVTFSPSPPEREMTVQQVVDRYLGDPTSSRTEKSTTIYRTTYATIMAIVGTDMPMAAINRESCRDILGVLQHLPSNSRKRWPDVEPREVAEMARRQGISPMSPANANEYMNKLSTLFNWAVKEEMVSRNPAKGLKLADVMTAREKRRPFAPDQLTKVFNAPIYRGCRDDGAGFAIQGVETPRRSRFWIPLLGLFTGMRLNEICQAHATDVREVEGVWCFAVSAAGAEDKQIKTAASERLVPIHPTLCRIGFLEYAAERRRNADVRLFPELSRDAFGLYSGRFSRWFARFLVTCDAAADRTCFHSFRHSFRDALREAKVDREIALALGGWASSGFNAGAVADSYGQGFSIAILADALAKISYRYLNLNHLYIADHVTHNECVT